MSTEDDGKLEEGGLTKGESNTSLFGEGIDSREGSPSQDVVEENDPLAPVIEVPASKSNLDEGKPPRAPTQTQSRPATSSDERPVSISRNSSGEQGRKRSGGGGDSSSVMSGLTDDGGYAFDFPSHQRSVSWDRGVANGDQAFARNPAPPLPPEAISTPPPPPPPPNERARVNWGKLRNKAGLNRVVEKDVTVKTVNPLESEAETAIIRALERTRRKNAAKAGNILPHVSSDAAEALRQDNARETGTRNGDDKSMLTGAGNQTAASGATSAEHRRTKTLDHTLFDLANELNTLQNGQSDHVVGQRERVLSGDSTGVRGRFLSEDTAHHHHKGNSADVLVHNAAVLFRRPITKKESTRSNSDSLEPPPSPPRVHTSPSSERKQGGLVTSQRSADTGSSHKKTDDPIPDEVESIEFDDVELGIEADVGLPLDESGEDLPPDGAEMKMTRLDKAGRGARRIVTRTNNEVKEDFETFRRFLQPRSGTIKFYLVFVVGCVLIPAIGVAAILFHSGNPGLGREGASTSWFILFLARQVITGTLAKATEVFVIDFLCLQLRFPVRVFGPIFTLLLVQSRGWPAIVFFWGLYNFGMNSGENAFAAHWLFWQDAMPLFNENNPSGTITFSSMNYTVNGIAVAIGFIVAIKRLWWGLYLGKRSYLHYGDELAEVCKDMVYVSKVATWAKDIERNGRYALKKRGYRSDVDLEALFDDHQVADFEKLDEDIPDVLSAGGSEMSLDTRSKVIDEEKKDKFTGTLRQSQKIKIDDLLGRWEEPLSVREEQHEVSIASILQFRQMLAYMDEDYPFSLAFGPADTREACIESAQKVYERLLSFTPDRSTLTFDTLAVLAIDKDGEIDTESMKELIRLFRPERSGDLSCLDFVKSCDEVYKRMRLLRASIANSGQIDHAFEVIVNVVFYVIVVIIILVVLGWDPLALFVSISGIVVAFAFMIGSASSKYFEGILFILVRRPYDIGDRVAVSSPESQTSMDGSATWFVQTVGLFTTTVRFAATNEVATLANGSLASSRVINAKRSPQAVCYVYMKFSVDISYSKILIFKKAIEAFVKERPREWLGLNGFRATHADPERNYIQYVIVLGHRESWQNIGSILQSKADVSSFCLEVAKKLDMRYIAPPLPVNLTMNPQSVQLDQVSQKLEEAIPILEESQSMQSPVHSPDVRSISAMFGKHEK